MCDGCSRLLEELGEGLSRGDGSFHLIMIFDSGDLAIETQPETNSLSFHNLDQNRPSRSLRRQLLEISRNCLHATSLLNRAPAKHGLHTWLKTISRDCLHIKISIKQGLNNELNHLPTDIATEAGLWSRSEGKAFLPRAVVVVFG